MIWVSLIIPQTILVYICLYARSCVARLATLPHHNEIRIMLGKEWAVTSCVCVMCQISFRNFRFTVYHYKCSPSRKSCCRLFRFICSISHQFLFALCYSPLVRSSALNDIYLLNVHRISWSSLIQNIGVSRVELRQKRTISIACYLEPMTTVCVFVVFFLLVSFYSN